MNIRHNPPPPGNMPDPLAPNIQRHPPENDHGRDGRHDAIRILVARLRNPRIRVERQQEAKERLEPHHRERDFARHGPVGVDHVDQTDVCALDGGKVYCLGIMLDRRKQTNTY